MASEVQQDTYIVIVWLYVIGSLCVLGLLGNALSFAVLHKHENLGPTTWLLKALALADSSYLLCSLIIFPLRIITVFTNWIPSLQSFYAYLFVAVEPFSYVCQMICLWSVTLVTYDRYLAVLRSNKPQLRSLKKAQICTAIIAVAAICLNIPRFFAVKVNDGPVEDWHGWYSGGLFTLYHNLYLCAIIATVSTTACMMVYLNMKMARELRINQQRTRHVKSSGSQRSETRVIVMLLVVVIVYVACIVPWSVIQIAFRIQSSTRERILALGYERITADMLPVINSSVNFLIYCLINRGFQNTLRSMFGCGTNQAVVV